MHKVASGGQRFDHSSGQRAADSNGETLDQLRRIVFRRRQKAAFVVVAGRLLIFGLALLIPAICSSVLLILHVLLGRWQAIVGCSVTVLVGLLTWYALPLAVRHAGHGVAPEPRRSRRSHATEI